MHNELVNNLLIIHKISIAVAWLVSNADLTDYCNGDADLFDASVADSDYHWHALLAILTICQVAVASLCRAGSATWPAD